MLVDYISYKDGKSWGNIDLEFCEYCKINKPKYVATKMLQPAFIKSACQTCMDKKDLMNFEDIKLLA